MIPMLPSIEDLAAELVGLHLPPLDVYENKQALLNRLLEERAREPLKQ